MAQEWAEDELVMISALEHYSYCPRQCALIYVEQVYDENLYTLRGNRAHERAHDEEASALEEGVRVERNLPLFSERLGLIGKADIVEFGPDDAPYPVEYKVGPRKQSRHDDLQLCAQALCLEEMFGLDVPRGAVFHHSSRQRRELVFDTELRRATEETVERVRQMILTSTVPPPVADARCEKCSLYDACLPFALTGARVDASSLFDSDS